MITSQLRSRGRIRTGAVRLDATMPNRNPAPRSTHAPAATGQAPHPWFSVRVAGLQAPTCSE